MEQEKKTGNVESVTLEQVPMEERKSWADVAMIQAGIMIYVPSLMLGGILAESMPMSQAIWSGVIGYAVIVALMIFCGIMATSAQLFLSSIETCSNVTDSTFPVFFSCSTLIPLYSFLSQA